MLGWPDMRVHADTVLPEFLYIIVTVT